ncbi:MAG: diaminopimelate decarboxylase [Deltaproteobacteria bacterium]|jgi:diaminopimelate decarboxylase|nr:MAG: diaminopimelate decarboxylase [Deltaproteobacteria bacterium]
MHDFQYKNDELYCEDIPVSAIADSVGTPFYLYSHNTLLNHFKVFDSAFSSVEHLVCFSVKANSNIAVLKTFINQGGGVDIVSGGELFRALMAGANPEKIVYSGVGKRVDEIEFALQTDILMFNIESTQELKVIDSVAGKLGNRARISFRINPDIDPKTHPYISTGLKKNKFGINIKKSLEEYRHARGFKHIDIVGVDCHIGSQITGVEPFVDALKRIKELVVELQKEGININYLDLGGGLGITYDQETPPHPNIYAQAIIKEVSDLNCVLILEPGRVIVGNAGILVTKALYTKKSEEKNFVIVDAGMNDLSRPALYGSFQGIQPVKLIKRKEFVADLVGPICESGDFLAKDRKMPQFERGDLVAVMSTGAYGFTMSSNYNSRPRIPEVMAAGDEFYIIREREEYDDLIRGENIPEFLKRDCSNS